MHLLGIEGLFAQGSRPGRSSADLVGGIFALDGSHWSNALRDHNLDTRTDTEFKVRRVGVGRPCVTGFGGFTTTQGTHVEDANSNVSSIYKKTTRRARQYMNRPGGFNRPLPDEVTGRGLHSSTFQLNFSVVYGIGGSRRGCVARVKRVLGGFQDV